MAFFHCYRAHRFNSAAQTTVDQANEIIREMREQGYVLTLRQLYYQFVARDLIPNENREYKRLGRLVTRARESGVMDWQAIEDRDRSAYGTNTEEDPTQVIDGIEHGLVFDQWARQDTYLEVWVEKSALEGVVARPCNRFHVTYMACRGYLSASAAWRSGLRFQNAIADGKRPVLIHLADHDPSGLHMTEDNRDRLQMFAEDYDVEVRRLALNMDQVELYDPPPNPAKQTDSRYRSYAEAYGQECWELDALNPMVLDTIIEDAINEYRDADLWNDVLDEQEEVRKPLAALSENWSLVEEFLTKEGLV
ncbi:MAG: hypothetical protein V3S55_15230 [Nitrospiraceae bacterium]